MQIIITLSNNNNIEFSLYILDQYVANWGLKRFVEKPWLTFSRKAQHRSIFRSRATKSPDRMIIMASVYHKSIKKTWLKFYNILRFINRTKDKIFSKQNINIKQFLFPKNKKIHSKKNKLNYSLTISWYSNNCLRIAELSVHEIKSSVFLNSKKKRFANSKLQNIYLVTRNAGSLTISGPIRICPCSINFTAAGKCCAIRFRVIITGNRRRQNRLAVILSINSRFSLVGIKPIECLQKEILKIKFSK